MMMMVETITVLRRNNWKSGSRHSSKDQRNNSTFLIASISRHGLARIRMDRIMSIRIIPAQPSNGLSPMEVTDDGMLISSNDLHL